jgi:hypothetical protein
MVRQTLQPLERLPHLTTTKKSRSKAKMWGSWSIPSDHWRRPGQATWDRY